MDGKWMKNKTQRCEHNTLVYLYIYIHIHINKKSTATIFTMPITIREKSVVFVSLKTEN